MRALVLAVIRRLGRYAVLLFAAFALGLAVFWFSLLSTDRYWTGLIGLFLIVAPAAGAAWALIVGMLFAGTRPIKGDFVSREDAPGLWSLWDEVAGRDRAKRQLRIDDTTGAWIAERHRAAGVALPEVTMSFGLGVLLALDRPAVRAVVAHEVAHSCLQHTSGGTRVAEFERTFVTLFERYPPDATITGWALHALFGRFGGWLEKEMTRISRANELAADRGLTGDGAADATARALVLVHALDAFIETEIAKPLERRLLGAIEPPPSPLRTLEERLPELWQPERLAAYAQNAWHKPAEPDSTHPSLQERLAALGYSSLPEITSPVQAAADVLLAPATRERLMASFDERWSRRALDRLQRQ